MSTPENMRFAKSHEWVLDHGDGTATVGITAHAQDQLGDVVYWEGPEEGEEVRQGEPLGSVESVKGRLGSVRAGRWRSH